MDLREYLFRKRLSITEFSQMVYVSRNYISLIIHNKATPSIRLAKAIERITDGEVTAESLLKEKGKEEKTK